MFKVTTATQKLLKLTKRIRGISGGTSASKTISIIMILIDYSQTHPGEIISIVSESFPHLKRGAIRDFLNIMQAQRYYQDREWNRTDSIYTFSNGAKIEFFSVDQSDKVRGARRDVLFINEANNIGLETFNQLEVRTRKIIWLDWNPTNEFWWYTDIAPIMDHDFLILTYRDNEALEQSVIDAIEARRHNKMWYQVYGLGQLGDVEGRIYVDWQILDDMPNDFPHEAKLWRYGLDFGYSNDPTAVVAVYKYNGGYILDEILYKKGLLNSQIAEVLTNKPQALIVADSAEPKSIDELAGYGLMIVPADKGADSVLNGIQYVQDQRVSITRRSVNLIKEYRNYMWMKDKNDAIINEPSDFLNHCMDALRYAIASGREVEWKPPADTGGVKPYYEDMPG